MKARSPQTREEFDLLQRIASTTTVSNANTNEIIHALHLFVDPERYVCPTCPSSVAHALRTVKAHWQAVKEEAETRLAEQDVRVYKEGGQ